jgi:hypothetical protein
MAHLDAIAGKNLPIEASFADAEGTPVDPDDHPVLTIYNRHRKRLHRIALDISHKTGTGTYVYNYTVPKDVLRPPDACTSIYADADAEVQGIPAIGARHTITVRWAR